jgi:nitrogen fixation/metabolism regulation signal transduction histidine kinase
LLSDCQEVKEMRERFQSGLTGLLFGGLWGGIVGAILFGLRAYFTDSSSTLGGADRNWTWLFMLFGLVFGLVVGAILGAILGAIHADRRAGISIGVAIGLLIAVVLSHDSVAPLIFTVVVSCSILAGLISGTLQARD